MLFSLQDDAPAGLSQKAKEVNLSFFTILILI